MKCPSCQMDNPADAAFCGRCGTRLAVQVPTPVYGGGAAPQQSAPMAGPYPASAYPANGSVTPPNTYSPNAPAYSNTPNHGVAPNPPPQSGMPPNFSAPPPFALVTLVCGSGPDRGKRLPVGHQEVVLGSAPGCALVSADPHVSPDHAGFIVSNGILHFRARSAAPLVVAHTPMQMGTLGAGMPLQIGQSEWHVEGGPAAAHFNAETMADWFGARISGFAGVDRLEGFRPGEMFSSLKDKHSEEEVEEFFITGTRTTTPSLMEIQAVWPKPWVFAQVFLALLVVFVGCAFGLNEFKNPNFLPGLMVIGSFVIPISVLLFYFEMNIPRNVSIYQVFKMVFIGGTLSLVVTLFGYEGVSALSFLGGIIPGIVEELGKVAALILVVNNRRYPWTLNGLLLGGAVGAGFAGFESAGYAFRALIQGDTGTMLGLIVERGLLAPGGHVAWAALNGAALWKVKGDQPFDYKMLTDIRFLRVLILTMVLHSAWDTIGNYPVWAVLIAIALTTVLMFVQDGIKQVQQAQVAAKQAVPFQGATL